MMNVLGIQLEFEFFDADQLEVYERANEKVGKDIADPQKYEGLGTADAIRMQCRIIDGFFDEVFGEGTARKIFRGKSNIRDHLEAFGIVSQGAQDARGELDAIQNKYSPNRAQRRQAEADNRQIRKLNSTNYNRHAAGKGMKQHH